MKSQDIHLLIKAGVYPKMQMLLTNPPLMVSPLYMEMAKAINDLLIKVDILEERHSRVAYLEERVTTVSDSE